jgi:hypothetical protein
MLLEVETNRPKIVSGTTYAQGGGPMGNMLNPDPSYKDTDNRINLIKELERYARSQSSSGGNGNIIKALNDVALTLKGQRTSNTFSSDNPLSSFRNPWKKCFIPGAKITWKSTRSGKIIEEF